ncbi:positive regulator of sigma E activity [Parabacteroides sp. PFB2-12]|uniref:SoxR reducing system RseC family protein n=1 Tax=unclassified Parabacteroides TaxID=2649774 RepID=UPI0024735573|nr:MULTISPECIES: SoxR reducing system RseC family protein [unclassified Parabacteroides]MDH6341639.1 positive regulator of sigma E activity [Parabacteroides sp. PM6-13]MDH6389938.1 positive regulator of sigma E activity [Parabacteroides sp. PFB2-12]
MNNTIRHNGIIERREGDIFFVRILQQSACAGCHARGVCGASESKEKVIEVSDRTGQFQVDDEVTITGQTSLGLQAVLLAFGLPVVLVIAAVAISLQLGLDETVSGLIGILLLIPYYVALYFMRDKLKRHFVFTLEKPNIIS